MPVTAEEGFRAWAPEYDRGPNPLLALEQRILARRIGPMDGKIFLDAGTGTGRWLKYARAAGARAIGIDLSAEMMRFATGSRVRGDIRRMPFADDAFDLAVCSLTLGYIRSPATALSELMRVARCVVVTDLHPAAVEAGWTRSFRIGRREYEIEHYVHSVRDWRPDWFIEARFGEPERRIFEAASRGAEFEKSCLPPALYAACWIRGGD